MCCLVYYSIHVCSLNCPVLLQKKKKVEAKHEKKIIVFYIFWFHDCECDPYLWSNSTNNGLLLGIYGNFITRPCIKLVTIKGIKPESSSTTQEPQTLSNNHPLASLLSTLQTWKHNLFCTLACWMSHQRKSALLTSVCRLD